MCRVGLGVVVWTVVYRKVGSVDGLGAEVLVMLLKLEDEVSGRGEVGVEGVEEVEAVTPKVSSSVICDLCVTVTGVVLAMTSVCSTGVSVVESSGLDVPMLSVGGAVVRPQLTLCSPVWDETPSVPSWF